MGYIADLSEWQGSVDFAKLSKVVDGVILRVQAGYTHPDSRYKEYVAGCKANNIPFGTYAYFRGVSIPDSLAEAKAALERMDKDSEGFALDIEEATCTDLIGVGQAYIDFFKNKGVKNVGLYSCTGFYAAHNLAAIKADWHWIASYGVNDGQQHTAPVLGEELWQFTSVGRLDGIAGNVDESAATGHFKLFFGSHTIVEPPVIQHVKALVKSDIRTGPSHTAGYIRDTVPGETFNVFARQGDWHCVGTDAWIDGNGGQNLSWIDNPALQQQAPQPVYYVVKPGDNLTAIANANSTTIAQLKTWNGIQDENKIQAGQRLRVK